MALPIRRRPLKEFTAPFCDTPFVVKPLSAETVGKLEERFPYDTDEKRRPNAHAFEAAMLAAACFEQVGTTDKPACGEQAWSETDLRGMDTGDFQTLAAIVYQHSGMVKTKAEGEGDSKNSQTPAASSQ